MDKDGIKKLSELSRLELTDDEIAEYAGEFSDILGYVDQLKEVAGDSEDLILESAGERNVMRKDENPHESGVHTEDLVNSAPNSEGEYIKVKKVL